MDADTEITKYTIVIIQSLKEKDLKTGELLYDNLSSSLPIKYTDTSVRLYDVKDKLELAKVFYEVYNGIEDGELLTLQIEAHGCEDGIGLSSDELVTWEEFYGLIRPINVKMVNLLLVCMSMCYGGALIKHIEPEKRAPYRAFIGTGSTIKVGVLLDGFSAFYEKYHNLLDLFAAYDALKNATKDVATGRSPFWFMTSEEVFKKTFDPDRDPNNFKHIVNEQYVRQRTEGKTVTKEQVASEIRDMLIETDKLYYENYTFGDIIPKHI